ncbi:MAG: hypothetical protein HKO91_05195 [Desulfobacterales bacterium]|nr:hypothetical protein [Desulfobacterales bacterium]
MKRKEHNLSDIDTPYVIMPRWIEYFDTQKLVLADTFVEPLISFRRKSLQLVIVDAFSLSL